MLISINKSVIQKQYGTKMSINSIHYDQNNGIGATSTNKNILLTGFVGYIKVDDFLQMIDTEQPINSESLDYLKDAIANGLPIASPILHYDNREYKITGHEGRHRAIAIYELRGGSAIIPTHITLKNDYIYLSMFNLFAHGVYAEKSNTIVRNALQSTYSKKYGYLTREQYVC